MIVQIAMAYGLPNHTVYGLDDKGRLWIMDQDSAIWEFVSHSPEDLATWQVIGFSPDEASNAV